MAKNKSNKYRKFAKTSLLALSATMFASGVAMLGVCGARLSGISVEPVPYTNVPVAESSGFVRYTSENISQLFASYPGLEDLVIIDPENGLTFRSGTVDPDNTLGVEGDTYLNSSSNDLFRKSKTGWIKVASISEQQ